MSREPTISPACRPSSSTSPRGDATVEVIPESSKLNINICLPADLFRLLSALGVPRTAPKLITEAIIDWRTPAPGNQPTPFDMFYLQHNPSFMAAHTSFQEIEDLLLVRGMTPDLFYGTWDRDDSVQPPRLTQRIGLRDCVSVYANGSLDVNTTPVPVLIASGFRPKPPPPSCQQRSVQPFPNIRAARPRVHAKHGTRRVPAHPRRRFHVHHPRHRPSSLAGRRSQRYATHRLRSDQTRSAGYRRTLSHCQVV